MISTISSPRASLFERARSLPLLHSAAAMTVVALYVHLIIAFIANNRVGRQAVFGVIVVTLMMIAAWIVNYTSLRDRLASLSLPLRTALFFAVLIGVTGLCTLWGILQDSPWHWSHTGLALALSGAALLDGLTRLDIDLRRYRRVILIMAIVVGIAFFLLRARALSYSPPFQYIDEPWDYSWVMTYVREGVFHDPIVLDGGADVQGFMMLPALWIKLVGAGMWEMRLFFMLCALPLAVLVGLAARRMYSPTVGWIAVLLTLTSVVIAGSARIRHDIGLAWAVAASLWLIAEGFHRHKNWLHLAAGLAMGLGTFAHYHAAGIGVALTAVFYLGRWIASPAERREIFRAMLFYIAGGFGGAIIVVLVQILPQWEGFMRMRQLRSPLSLSLLIENLIGHADSIGEHSRFELLLAGVSLIGLALRRTRIDRLLLAAIALGFVVLTLLARGWPHYVVHIMPLILIGGAASLAHFADSAAITRARLRASLPRRSAIAVVLIVLPFAAVMAGEIADVPINVVRRGDPMRLETPPAVAWINENIPAGSTITSPNWYYFWIEGDLTFISPLSVYDPTQNDSSDEALYYAEWEVISPDVVMSDSRERYCCFSHHVFNPEWLAAQGYQEVVQFEAENGRRILTVYIHSRIADAVSHQGE